MDDLGVYASRLAQSEPEQQALIEEVVIPESWFFRDERPFLWLAGLRASTVGGRPVRAPLRVLSLACAGGEEPYSIAITLRDAGLPARRFRIDAVNVSARRLASPGMRDLFGQRLPRLRAGHPGAILPRACPGLRGHPRDPIDGPLPPGQRARPEAARRRAPL